MDLFVGSCFCNRIKIKISSDRPLYQLETLWFKDDVPIEHSGVTFSFNGLWNRTLSLLQTDLHYAGLYRCQVRLLTRIDEPLQAEAYVTIHGMLDAVPHYLTIFLSFYRLVSER